MNGRTARYARRTVSISRFWLAIGERACLRRHDTPEMAAGQRCPACQAVL